MDIAGVDVEIDVIKEYPELEDLVVNSSTEDQNFNSSKYGFKSVTINAIKGEELDLNPSTEQQNVEGVFTKVKVNAIKTQKLNTVPSTQEQVITGLFDEVTVNAIEGQELNLNPSEEQQNFEGVFLGVNVNPIQIEEITTDLDFSNSDAIELTAQEGVYIKKATINKDANLSPENIKRGVSVCGISGEIADSADADATANDILLNKTAYVGNQKVVGTLEVSNHNATINTDGVSTVILKNMIKEIDFTNISLAITTTGFCSDFNGLTKIKGLDMSNSNTLYTAFKDCTSLQELEISNTSNVTTMFQAFYKNTSLHTLPQLQADKVSTLSQAFYNCSSLKNFGGLLNLGKAYTGTTANNSAYTLDLSACPLTYDSLMNIVNGLYDLNLTYGVADGGTLYAQTLKLGTGNQTRLGSEGIAIATAKGWNVS